MKETWSFEEYANNCHRLGQLFFQVASGPTSNPDAATYFIAGQVVDLVTKYLQEMQSQENGTPPRGSFWQDMLRVRRSYDYITGRYLSHRLREVIAEVRRIETSQVQPLTIADANQQMTLMAFIDVFQRSGRTLESLSTDLEACIQASYADFIADPSLIDARLPDDVKAYCLHKSPISAFSLR